MRLQFICFVRYNIFGADVAGNLQPFTLDSLNSMTVTPKPDTPISDTPKSDKPRDHGTTSSNTAASQEAVHRDTQTATADISNHTANSITADPKHGADKSSRAHKEIVNVGEYKMANIQSLDNNGEHFVFNSAV